MPFSLRTAGFLALIALPAWTDSGAEVFRWVDDEGGVHYGDRPPPGTAARAMDLPETRPAPGAPEPADRARARRKLLEYFEDKRAEEQAEREQARRDQEARAERCRRAQDALERYNAVGRIYRPTPEGGREYLSAEQRDALIAELEDRVERWCDRTGGGSGP